MALPPYLSGLTSQIVDAVTAETEGALGDLVTAATTQADRAEAAADEAAATVANKPDRNLALFTVVSDGGTANAQTASVAPTGMSSYIAGQTFLWIPNATNTTSTPTLNIAGIGARTVQTAGGGALAAGDIVNGRIYLMRMSGTGNVKVVGILPSEVRNQALPT